MRLGLRFSLLLSLLLVGGCAEITRPSNRTWQRVELDSRVVQAYSDFGLRLFGAVVAEDPTRNIFISPTSAAFALAMTYNGAAGETQQAMARTLGLESVSVEAANRANAAWLAALREVGDEKAELSLANSLWIRRELPVHSAFLDRNRSFYSAEITNLDFNSPAAVETINGWVNRNTRGRITEIVESIDPLDMLFLINALYFKADWTHPFDKRLTTKSRFRTPDGTWKEVAMMEQQKAFPYYKGDGFQMVSLPYGNGRFSMLLALPDENVGLAGFYRKLTPAAVEQWTSRLDRDSIQVALPRFTLEWEAELNDALSGLGMQIAFNPRAADFSGISPAAHQLGLHIGDVKQKTFVKVNEDGTEAAAVTSVKIVAVCAGCAPPVLTFDRPFWVAIRDNATDTLLFIGQVVDPDANK